MELKRMFVHSLAVTTLMGMSLFAVAQDTSSSGGASAGGAQADQTGKPAKSAKKSAGEKGGMDKRFVTEAAQGGMAEVALGNVAKSNGQNDAVKQFGDRMVTDHGKANDELKQLAQQKSWTLPTDADAKHKKDQDMLQGKQGADFDKMYMQHMVKDHQKDVKAFQRCANSCTDPDLKAWASKTLPTLQEHLQMAQQAAQQVGAPMAGGAGHAGHMKKSGKKASADSAAEQKQ